MNTSPTDSVRDFYEDSADGYSAMMDAEIELPLYADTLGRLAARLAGTPGPVIDTSCGSGHMLLMYHERFDSERALIAMDLSPQMVEITRNRLGAAALTCTADMRDLRGVNDANAAALLSFFALHHLDPAQVQVALQDWHRVLRPAGQLVLATWEGLGLIDYGEMSDLDALRYTEGEVRNWVQKAGFTIDRCQVEPVEDMPMAAIYLEATKR